MKIISIICVVLLSSCSTMNYENTGWKKLFFVNLGVSVDIVRCEGIQLYSDHMSVLSPKHVGSVGYNTQEIVSVNSKIEIEWKEKSGVSMQQTIDRPADIPATINEPCHLVFYYDKEKWFLRYIESDKIISHKELKQKVLMWSNHPE